TLSGKVVGDVAGNPQEGGIHFRLRDVKGTVAVPVVYKGSVPDLFRTGRDISLDGRLRNGVFVGVKNTLVTKCPSKYSPKKK
nr:cytochrome c maturation protein CcmE [Actinomycetota bacterium]